MQIYIVSDFFIEEVSGGAEINDFILYNELNKKLKVKRIRSHELNENLVSSNSFFIISNFLGINLKVFEKLTKNKNYLLYEHDHKYVLHRNPGMYENFIVPENEIINKEFYENAIRVFVQSNFHKNIVENNLRIKNVVSLSGNLWDDKTLEYLTFLSKKEKKEACSIMFSNIPHKNMNDSIKFCEVKNLKYELVEDKIYEKFLEKLSNNNTLIFFPKTPETLSRICVEARMCNMKVITNALVGAAKEEWYKFKGLELIDIMKYKKQEIINLIIEVIK